MIFSGGFLRKPPLEIDFYMRFLKKTATRNHGFFTDGKETVNKNSTDD
jgi:hypothetical protein